jgi:cell division septation protein DedD
MALNASSANVLTLGSTIQATIKDVVVAPKPVVTQPTAPTTTQTPAPTTTVKPNTTQQPTTTQSQASTEQPAAQTQVTAENNQPNANQASLLSSIGSLLTLRTNNFLVGLIVVLVIVAIIIYAIQYFKPKKNGKSE